jgi:hypothetical protein
VGRLAAANAAIVCGAMFCGVSAARAGDLTDSPADLAVAAPDPRPDAVQETSRPMAKTARKLKPAALKPSWASAATSTPPAPEKPVVAPKASGNADGPLSLGLKWNAENETDYGAATVLRDINQRIDSNILGGSAQPVGAGAEVGVKYKF